jgi:hypothetical protein|tara:strand:- start:436 stop:831 length:396 start_codon:yes stop_codon:yes gene_type:complete
MPSVVLVSFAQTMCARQVAMENRVIRERHALKRSAYLLVAIRSVREEKPVFLILASRYVEIRCVVKDKCVRMASARQLAVENSVLAERSASIKNVCCLAVWKCVARMRCAFLMNVSQAYLLNRRPTSPRYS